MSAVDDYNTCLLAKREKLNKGNDVGMVSLLLKGFKTTGIAIAVWCWGYLGMSVAWIFVLLFFHIVSDEVSKQIKSKRKYALQAMCSEKGAILSRVDKSHASWIYFPEVERAEWLNKMVKQLWPVIAEYVENLIMTTIQDSIQGYMPSNLGVFKFNNVDMGDIPIRIEGVKVYTDVNKKDEIIVDINLRYSGDANIKCTVKGINFGIKTLRINGKVRCVINPLISEVPIIGGLTVFFLNCPDVNFDMTAAANILDVPLIKKTINEIICKVVSDICVLPRRIPISLHHSVDSTKIRYPPPEGLVIIHMLEGKDLKPADINIMGKGKSDPYCTLTVGNQMMRTKTIKSSLEPVWDEYFQGVVDQTRGQVIDIRVFDEDQGSTNDDPLGNATLDIEMVAAKKNVEIWLPLANAPSGSIHLRALWMAVSNKMDDFKPRELNNTVSDNFATAILLVIIDSAKNIPKSLNTNKERNPYLKMKVDHDVRRTTIKYATGNPVWGENFNYFLTNPQKQQLELELKHKGSSKETTLASLMVPINSVILTKDLSLTQEYPLPEVAKDCSITLRFILRVLKCSISPSEWSELSGSAALSLGSVLKQQFSSDTPSNNCSNSDNIFSFGLGNISEDGEGVKGSIGDDDVIGDNIGESGGAAVKKEKNEEEAGKRVVLGDLDFTMKQISPPEPTPPRVTPTQPAPTIDIKKEIAKNDPLDDSNYRGDYKEPQKPSLPHYEAPKQQQPPQQQQQPLAPTPVKQPTPSPPQVPKFTPTPQPIPTEQGKPADVVAPKKPPRREYPADNISMSKAHVMCSKFGQIQLTVRHSANRNKLVVVVHQCKSLIPCDKDNLADPYVRMYLLPDRSAESKRKTKLIKNTLNPTFDETFEWEMGTLECPFRTLEVAVKNDVGVFSKSRTDMGVVTIELSKLGDLSQAVTHWFDLQDPKGH